MSTPDSFEMLAVYNSERARGIVHTPEWDARMAALQVKFDEAVAAKLPDYRTADGTYIFPGYDRMPEALWDSIKRALKSAHPGEGQ